MRRFRQGPQYGTSPSFLHQLIVQEWFPSWVRSKQPERTTSEAYDRMKNIDLLSIQARIYFPVPGGTSQGYASHDSESEPSLCLRFQLIGMLKTGTECIEWITDRPVAYCHGIMAKTLFDDYGGLAQFYLATFINNSSEGTREYYQERCRFCDSVCRLKARRFVDDDGCEVKCITITRWINLGAGLDPVDFFKDRHSTEENYGLPDNLDARECFNNGYEDSEYVMSEEELWECNFALLKSKSYKRTMKYIGDGSKPDEWVHLFDRCPTWIVPIDRLEGWPREF